MAEPEGGDGEPGAWEEADILLGEMRALTATLKKEEASIADHESAADQQKDNLHDALASSAMTIVAAVAAEEVNLATTAGPFAEMPEQLAEMLQIESTQVREDVDTADAAEPANPPQASSTKPSASSTTVPSVGLLQRKSGTAAQTRFKKPEPSAASLTSEISRLASKPLLPTPMPPRKPNAR